MKAIVLAVIVVSLACFIVACGQRSESSKEIIVGGLYATKDKDGVYRISKILAVDKFAVHERIYKNKFKILPQNLDSSVLSLGGLGDPEGFGMGHVPLAKEGFWQDSPVFLKKEPVREEELEGYKYYLAQMKK